MRITKILSILCLSSCSVVPVNDYCIENAPGLGNEMITGEDLSNSNISIALEGPITSEAVEIGTFLRSEGITATYFLTGKSIEGQQAKMQTLRDQNHYIGNGGFTGRNLFESEDYTSEVRLTDALISPYVINNVFLFRPPSGEFDKKIVKRLNQEGLNKYVGPIGYDQENLLDAQCWADGLSIDQCQAIYLEIIGSRQGGLYAFSTDSAQTVAMLATLIPALRLAGNSFVSIVEIPSVLISARNNGATPDELPPISSCNDYD